jgi:hypothetical protein
MVHDERGHARPSVRGEIGADTLAKPRHHLHCLLKAGVGSSCWT